MDMLKWWVYALNGLVAALVLLGLGITAASKRELRNPGRLQLFFEWAIDGLRGLFGQMLGEGGEKHLPLAMGLFFYILFCNLIGQVPCFKSPTSDLSVTLGLALIVFFYVQYVGIRSKGILGYLAHFLGPLLVLAPLFILIETVGELAKPVSLSMRLYGNIFGEDVINGLVTNGSAYGPLKIVPFQFLVYLLQLFTDILQAFVFTLLTCAYISIMSQHHDDNGDKHDSHPHKESREERFEEAASSLAGPIGNNEIKPVKKLSH